METKKSKPIRPKAHEVILTDDVVLRAAAKVKITREAARRAVLAITCAVLPLPNKAFYWLNEGLESVRASEIDCHFYLKAADVIRLASDRVAIAQLRALSPIRVPFGVKSEEALLKLGRYFERTCA